MQMKMKMKNERRKKKLVCGLEQEQEQEQGRGGLERRTTKRSVPGSTFQCRFQSGLAFIGVFGSKYVLRSRGRVGQAS